MQAHHRERQKHLPAVTYACRVSALVAFPPALRLLDCVFCACLGTACGLAATNTPSNVGQELPNLACENELR